MTTLLRVPRRASEWDTAGWDISEPGTSAQRIFAHRGFSSRQPEMTLAAYQEAIQWSLAEGVPLGLECDVHFSADEQLVCLHDRVLDRTSDARGLVADWTLAQLRRLDFGSWKVLDPAPEQRSLVTLAELMALVAGARIRGADVSLVIETKHPSDRGLAIEQRVCQMLAAYGWDVPGAPVRLITFSVPAAELLAQLVPDVDRTLLIEHEFGRFADGTLPGGIHVAGVAIDLLRQHPDFVERARAHGNEVHVWTVDDIGDIELCRSLGVTGFTSDYPDRVRAVLYGPAQVSR